MNCHVKRHMTHAERRERRAQMRKAVKAGESVADVAARFGVCVPTVRHAATGVLKSQPRAPRISWLVVDWSKTDSELAREHGLSRERFRQVRKKLGKPDADYKHSCGSLAKAVAAVAAHPDPYRISPKWLAKSAGVSPIVIVAALKKLGIRRAADAYSSKLPHLVVNWDLPNIVLAKVWGLHWVGVSRVRYSQSKGHARWDGRSTKLLTDPEFINAFTEEEAKAAKWREIRMETRRDDKAKAPAVGGGGGRE